MAAGGLGDLLIRMGADVARLQTDFGKAVRMSQDTAGRIKSAFHTALGTLGVGLSVNALKNFIDKNIEAGDRLNDLRIRTGLSADELNVLDGAAQRGGGSLASIGEVTSKLSKRMTDAARGTGESAAAFKAMGIEIVTAEGRVKSVGQILSETGVKFEGYEEGANKAMLATAAFGRGGDLLVPVVQGIEETRKRYQRLGITVGDDFTEKADKFKDTMLDITALSQAQGRAFAQQLLPTLQNLVERYVELKKEGTLLEDSGRALEVIIRGLASATVLAASGFMLMAKGVGLLAFAARDVDVGKFSEDFMVSPALAFIKQFRKLRTPSSDPGLREEADRLFADFDKQMKIAGDIWANKPLKAEMPKIGGPKGGAPGVPDLAAMKAAGEAEEKYKAEQIKRAFEFFKNDLKLRESIMELHYSNGLVNDTEYRKAKLDNARTEARAEGIELDKLIRLEEDKKSKAGAGTKDYFVALNAIEELKDKQIQSANKLKLAEEQIWFGAANAAKQYRDSVSGLQAQLLEMQGRSKEAAVIQFDRSNRDVFLKAYLAEDEAVLKLLASLRDATAAQAAFNQVKTAHDDIGTRLSNEEERIQNSLRTGAITELEGLARTSRARQNALGLYQKQIELLHKIAAETADPEVAARFILQIEQMEVAMERLATQSDLVGDKFRSIMENAGADAFHELWDSLARGESVFKSLGNAVKAFGASVVRMIDDIVAKALAQKIAESLFPAGGGGGGGLLSGFGSLLFGGGGGAAGAAAGGASSGLTGAADILANLAHSGHGPGDAMATRVVPRAAFANAPRFHSGVGPNERAAILLQTESVLTRGQMNQLAPISALERALSGMAAKATRGGGGSSDRPIIVNPTFNIGGDVDQRARQQILVAVGLGIQKALAEDT